MALLSACAAGAVDINTFHGDSQRTGWNSQETILTPANVASAAFGQIWASPILDGSNPHVYACPLFVDSVAMATPSFNGKFRVVFAATTNCWVYAINAAQANGVAPGTILWKISVGSPGGGGSQDGAPVGVLSTPHIDVAHNRIYVTATDAGVGAWRVWAIDIRTGVAITGWPLVINDTTVNPICSNGPSKFQSVGSMSQRGGLNLSSDGAQLYVPFGGYSDSAAGFMVVVNTNTPALQCAFTCAQDQTAINNGGMWASGGPAIDSAGNIYSVTGNAPIGAGNKVGLWGQSLLVWPKPTTSGNTALNLSGTYTPFNWDDADTADIDLCGSAPVVIPDLSPALTSTPSLLTFGGKQGNIYLVNRAAMPGSLTQRPAINNTNSTLDKSLWSATATYPWYSNNPGPLNVFGPYEPKTGNTDHAKSRSTPVYYRAPDGTNYIYASGSTKTAAGSTTNKVPSLAKIKINLTPNQPAFLSVDSYEQTLVCVSPGSPIVSSDSNGNNAIVWLLEAHQGRSANLSSGAHPQLHAVDATTMQKIWTTNNANDTSTVLDYGGKYNACTVAHGMVFVGTDRIQTFGLNNVYVGNVGDVVINNGTLRYAAPTSTSNRAVTTSDPNATLDVPNTLTISTPLGGIGSVNKTNSGTVFFNAANTYTGATNVKAGRLRGNGSITGNLVVTGTVYPGATTTNTSPGEVFTVKGSADFGTNGGTLRVRVSNTSPVAPTSDKLSVGNQSGNPLGGTSKLELLMNTVSGNYSSGGPYEAIVLQTNSAAITGPFSSVTYNGSPSPPAGISVVYRNGPATVTPSAQTPADRVVFVLNGSAVTPVTVDRFAARSEGAGVVLEWHCVSEFQNAGFNLFRRYVQSEIGPWVQVNLCLIPGRITDPRSLSYQFYDWPAAGRYEYRLETVSLAGTKESSLPVAGTVTIAPLEPVLRGVSADGLAAAEFSVKQSADVVRAQEYTRAFMVLEGRDPLHGGIITPESRAHARALNPVKITPIERASSASAPAATQDRNADPVAAQPSIASIAARWFTAPAQRGRDAVKVVYANSGVLKIDTAALPPGFDVNRLRITREGLTVPALASNAGGLYLYAPGYSDDYTDKDVFFLNASNAPTPGAPPAPAHGLFGAAAVASSPANVTQQFHDVYFDFSVRPLAYPPWFSNQYLSAGSLRSFPLNVPNAVNGAASLTLNLWSLSDADTASADHSLQAVLNGTPIGEAAWVGGGKMLSFHFDLPAGVIQSGNNNLDLVTPVVPGVTGGTSLLHSISIDYSKALTGPGPVQLQVSSRTAGQVYEVASMPSANIWVVDARYPAKPALVAYESQAQPGGTFAIRFAASPGGTGNYLAVPYGGEIAPLSVLKRTPKPIRSGVGYLATGPAQFGAVLTPLLTARNKAGLRALFVDQEDIFDYYGYGRYGPAPIQNAVRALRPQYLLLAGRTTYDYRNYSGTGVDPLCPSFLVSTTFWAQSESDAQFGDLGRGYSEVAVGRLPFDTLADMAGAVSRSLSYAGLPPSGWRGHMVTDQTDLPNFDFPAEGQDAVAAVPDFTWTANYLGVTSPSAQQTTAALRQAASGDADVIMYIGHGNASGLGRISDILDTSLVKDWTGNVIFLQASCTGNWFAKDVNGWHSIAAQALYQPQGGIAASISSATYMESIPHVAFMKQLLLQVKEPGVRWGTAVMKTQQWAAQQSQLGGIYAGYYADLSRTECILGDPALPMFKKE